MNFFQQKSRKLKNDKKNLFFINYRRSDGRSKKIEQKTYFDFLPIFLANRTYLDLL